MNARQQQCEYSVRNRLRELANRIRVAGENGRGVRLSTEETRLLLSYNLPGTGEGIEVMDGGEA